MKLSFLATISMLGLYATTLPGSAAIAAYLEQRVSSSPTMFQQAVSGTQKIWIEEDRLRMEDSSSGMISIVRLDSGMFYLVNPALKTVNEIPIEKMKAMISAGLAMFGSVGKATLIPTDDTTTIGSWTARKVTLVVTGLTETRMTLWLSKDIGLDMRSWIRIAETFGVQGLLGDALSKLSSLDGYPVKHETVAQGIGITMRSTTELMLYHPGYSDGSLFEPPKQYKKTIGMPGLLDP